jgi:ribosomal protein L29
MPVEDFRSMSVEELLGKEQELREELSKVSMKRHARRLDRSSDLGATKKELARLLTVIGEKRRAGGQGAS